MIVFEKNVQRRKTLFEEQKNMVLVAGSKAEVTKETMERGNTTRGGGRGEKGGEGGATGFEGTNPIKRKRVTTTTTTGGNSNNNKQTSPRPHPPPLPLPSPSSSMLLAQPRPCLVQCLSYLDSESIRQVCLLSKELIPFPYPQRSRYGQ